MKVTAEYKIEYFFPICYYHNNHKDMKIVYRYCNVLIMLLSFTLR